MDTEWKVNHLPSASSELDQLNDSVREQAIQSIEDLAEDPFPVGSIPLRGHHHFVSDSFLSGPVPGHLSSFRSRAAGVDIADKAARERLRGSVESATGEGFEDNVAPLTRSLSRANGAIRRYATTSTLQNVRAYACSPLPIAVLRMLRKCDGDTILSRNSPSRGIPPRRQRLKLTLIFLIFSAGAVTELSAGSIGNASVRPNLPEPSGPSPFTKATLSFNTTASAVILTPCSSPPTMWQMFQGRYRQPHSSERALRGLNTQQFTLTSSVSRLRIQ
jgi:hypothetical protein